MGVERVEWKKVPGLELEMSRSCRVKRIGEKQIYSPVRMVSESFYQISVHIKGHKIRKSARKMYQDTFGEKLTGKFAEKYETRKKKSNNAIKEPESTHCPYGKGWIKPLYGKMGTEFSPLDAYHESLTEAVKVRGKQCLIGQKLKSRL